ncbi:hypothetical protein KL911_002988 [Ogataea haglerorum]|uniref:uncharacterized protein n=1 Tax=Ogataea haglerorum TaxID=1937702 RepID=UPI001C89706B|nr:uncharacterized protein KL911_002988 [Ogataea haglerorum]KAG7747215.1 hypothetical protein KL912_003239 [Ogataea haglerorum]KAG7752883.1 hypothetical protein KL911_002988 [Ogataea haglerorum]
MQPPHRGGTFTDCIATSTEGNEIILKVLSVDPKNYEDAPVEAIRRVLEIHRGTKIPRGEQLDLYDVSEIRLGTTVSTNALLERKGSKVALFVTRGFRDVLHIGDQSRPYMFDFKINKHDTLASDVWEVDERVTVETSSEYKAANLDFYLRFVEARSITNQPLRIIEPLNVESTTLKLQEAKAKGYDSVAFSFLHSYLYPKHEEEAANIAESLGFKNIVLSSEVSALSGFVGRTQSSVADAYVTPVMKDYVRTFACGFVPGTFDRVKCQIMQSDGGLISFEKINGLRSLLSGPAGGVIGYSKSTYNCEKPLIGFDMGGTSTDVSRYDGKLEHVFETVTAGVSIRTPQLDINTVAAGGGSILEWKNGLFTVGPRSASSHPGPACYRKNGPLTVTDANLITGRLIEEFFPKAFGPNEDEPLDYNSPLKKFEELTREINESTGTNFTVFDVAEGFLKVANVSMSRPIKALTESKGHKASDHVLCSFGGAGGQHACHIAQSLGITKVCIHKHSSLLSAYGISVADSVIEKHLPCSNIFTAESSSTIFDNLLQLQKETENELGESDKAIESKLFLNLKYKGSNTTLMVEWKGANDIISEFEKQHLREFGLKSDREVVVESLRVRSIASGIGGKVTSPLDEEKTTHFKEPQTNAIKIQKSFFDSKFVDCPVYVLEDLQKGDLIPGPAFIVNDIQTLVIIPNATAKILTTSVLIDVPRLDNQSTKLKVDPIELSVFNHRFMSIAEQMGRSLQRSSISTNIKERLDFTCSVFSADGGLVANAPHVPAMIGSMAYAVKWQIDYWGKNILPGDVIISNSPIAGGTHLPDITLITPVFDDDGSRIIFWTASRGHHADIGGILPGSMPPNSTQLWQEGAIFKAVKAVKEGVFDEQTIREILYDHPCRMPGNHGTRTLSDNICDIKAQIAANAKGISLIKALMNDYGMHVVHLYMNEIQSASELAVRNLLKDISKRYATSHLEAEDNMDDGTVIHLEIDIDTESGSAVFDFSGTGSQVNGNWNAPIAVTQSSIIFALRCMVEGDIPLNQGCLAPISINVPQGTLLRPDEEVAVCAGNGLTSQRIVDVIFRAFEYAAACGGDMSNFTIGVDGPDGFGYYETVCNGSGAGPGWHGVDAVQTNMTNTKITDAESYEQRYPVVLRRFGIRKDSGGAGKFKGGNGAVREIEATSPLVASILSERRVFAPYGLAGGSPGKRGKTMVKRVNGSVINLGGKSCIYVAPGDRIIIKTPGGGGYGSGNSAETVSMNDEYLFQPRANGSVEIMRELAETN